jgi:hypothetical protein
MRHSIAISLFALSLAAPSLAQQHPPRPVDGLRDEARALMLVQSTLDWYTRTVGENSILAETYKGHERLFSKDSIALVQRSLAAPALSADDKRALQFLKSYLANEFINQHVAHFDDESNNTELHATARLSFVDKAVPYKQLEVMLANEPDAKRRTEIESARAATWRDLLNPILARKEDAIQRLAKQLGYKSYVALSEEQRWVDLKPLIAEGHRFLVATDPIYRPLLAEVAEKELHIPVRDLRRGDFARLRKAPRFEKFLPKELMLPAFVQLLAGIGLDLKTAAGTEIRIDDTPNPLKEPRAACFSIRVPGDIRVTVKPTGGIDDFATFFHEGGHAVHYANTTTTIWEFQQLGSNAATESFAELFGHVWDDPMWLRRYRAFVKQYNIEHSTHYPLMTDGDINELARVRVLNDLFYIRRYASAKLVYESVLHGGEPELWRGAYEGPTADLMQLYRALFERAYGFTLSADDALRFRTDVDDTFYAADYARAFGLANLMHEGLRAKFGGKNGDWYENKEVGPFLKKLYAEGQKPQPDELAQTFGYDHLDFRPTEIRAKRLLAR